MSCLARHSDTGTSLSGRAEVRPDLSRNVGAGCSEQVEAQTNGILRSRAVQSGVDLTTPRCPVQLEADIGGRLAFCVDDVIGAVFFCDGKFLVTPGEGHHYSPRAQQLCVLHSVGANS